MTRRGDEPGYYLSAEFWADRYRDFVVGRFTDRATIQKRQEDLAEESKRRREKISKSDT